MSKVKLKAEPLPQVIIWRIENKSDKPVDVPFVWPLGDSSFVSQCEDWSIKCAYTGWSPEKINVFFRSHIAKGRIRIYVDWRNDSSDIEDYLDCIEFTSELPSGQMRQYLLPVKKEINQVQPSIVELQGEAILDCTSMWSLRFKRACSCTIAYEHKSSFGSTLSSDLNLYVDSIRPKWWQFIKRVKYNRAVKEVNELFAEINRPRIK